jgi:glyoxylase I family protein
VARLGGRLCPVLSVREAGSSARWYVEVLGFELQHEFVGPDGRVHDAYLVQPDSGIELCLVGHPANDGEPFSELRTGLDHLEFLVDERRDLQAWVERLDELGVAHSGLKVAPASRNAMVTVRDPDNIQLELFWKATGAEGGERPEARGATAR